MTTPVKEIKTEWFEVRVGGRFGPTRKDGRRGQPLFRVEIPREFRTWFADVQSLPLPDGISACIIYMGDLDSDKAEVLRSWTSADHKTDERVTALSVDLAEVEGLLRDRRGELEAVGQRKSLLEQANTLLESQALAKQQVVERLEAQTVALQAFLIDERKRVQDEIKTLDDRVKQISAHHADNLAVQAKGQTAALEEIGRGFREQLAQLQQVGSSLMEREIVIAKTTAARIVDLNNQALLTQGMLGELLDRSRTGAMSQILHTAPTGPTTSDKLIDLAKEWGKPDGIVDRTLDRFYPNKEEDEEVKDGKSPEKESKK